MSFRLSPRAQSVHPTNSRLAYVLRAGLETKTKLSDPFLRSNKQLEDEKKDLQKQIKDLEEYKAGWQKEAREILSSGDTSLQDDLDGLNFNIDRADREIREMKAQIEELDGLLNAYEADLLRQEIGARV